MEKRLYEFGEDDLRQPRSRAVAAIEQPRFLDRALESYFWPVAEKLNNYLDKRIGVRLSYRDLKLTSEELPAGINGLYSIGTGSAAIDRRLPPSYVSKVIGHELVHYAQDKLGGIREMARRYGDCARGVIEGAATNVADYLNGESGAYRTLKNWYRKKFGRYGAKGAIQGLIPARA